jgi:hypothetical protein
MESLKKIITFHERKCTADGCNGSCNQDNNTYVDASYDSDDLDDEDDLLEPASEKHPSLRPSLRPSLSPRQ